MKAISFYAQRIIKCNENLKKSTTEGDRHYWQQELFCAKLSFYGPAYITYHNMLNNLEKI